MFVAYFDFYLLLICIMLWLFAANKVVYISVPPLHIFFGGGLVPSTPGIDAPGF